MNAKDLKALSDDLFSKKQPLTSLHQEVAENFYPERATFTYKRSIGSDFAANLMTSYPVLCRRDLGNQFATMLRPTAKSWFHPSLRGVDRPDNETLRFLDRAEVMQRRAMYDPISQFTRATKEGDHDFAAFGQCAISVELARDNRHGSHLLYRCWHLRDLAWMENEFGRIETIFRKWKPTAQTVARLFPRTVHQSTSETAKKTPFGEVELLHMIVASPSYEDGKFARFPFTSVWYDAAHDIVLEETGLWNSHYVIPRWQTVSGSQYSYSPATVAALPDARLIQAMTFTLLEAGEKATSPPVIATQDAVRSDVALFAGGITWVDNEYDERLGDALRPLTQDFRGFNFGRELNADARAMIMKAFYLDTLTMPQRGPEMTAYEVSQRVQEYIRNALPIFEPLEAEYNSAICERTFDILWRNGALGDPRSWPKQAQEIAYGGVQVEYRFESPLHDAIEQQKSHKILEVKTLLADAAAIDPESIYIFDVKVALRDAMEGLGTPAEWMRSKDEVDAAMRQKAQAQQQQAMLAQMETASKVAGNLSEAQANQAGAAATMPMPATVQ